MIYCYKEKYLLVLPKQLKHALIRFRMSNHNLPIENGRYNRTERKNRICSLCLYNHIGDEYHYFIKCQYFKDSRSKYVPKSCWVKPSVFKF